MDVLDEKVLNWDETTDGKGALLMFLPEQIYRREWVQGQYPGGREGEVLGRQGEILFYTYLLPPAADR